MGNGLALSFVDASASKLNFPRDFDQNGLLVPDVKSITLQVDTYDNACGTTPDTPCTGTWTQYDNSKVTGAGIGYRVVSTSPSTGSTVISQTLAAQLLYGGRYNPAMNDMNGGISVMCVATPCYGASNVDSQVDYYSASHPLAAARPARRSRAIPPQTECSPGTSGAPPSSPTCRCSCRPPFTSRSQHPPAPSRRRW